MEIAIYSVLILALAAFAGYLLYVRFSEGREKSLHHPPRGQEASEMPASEPRIEESIEEVEEIESKEFVPVELPAARAEAIHGDKKEEERKSEYLDELQEAAAGLAMLMRSSASNRTAPVVFAPEDEEVESTEEESADVSEAEPVVEAEAEEVAEAIVETEFQEEAPAEPSKKTLAELLGSEVTDQMEQIDSGLDELEELVVSIEKGLSVLAPAEESGEIEEFEISEAA